MIKQKIQELEEKIYGLKKRWPAHSVHPGMMVELDELEDKLIKVLEQLHQDKVDA